MIDVQLGRLCKLLRFAGFDCVSAGHLSQGAVISLCIREKRLFLSRNKHLSAMIRHIPHLLIDGEYVSDQLAEIRRIVPFNPEMFFTRCTVCNHELIPVNNQDVKIPGMPENPVALKICPHCNHYYWKGSHFERMSQTLLSISE